MKRLALLGLVAFLLGGCYRIHYTTGRSQQPTPKYTKWQHHMVFGLITLNDPVAVDEICPEGFAEVYSRLSFLNWLTIVAIDGGANAASYAATFDKDARPPGYFQPPSVSIIWLPTTVSVTCAQSVAERPGPRLAPAPDPEAWRDFRRFTAGD